MALLDTIKQFGTRIMQIANTPVVGAGGIIDNTPAILRAILNPSDAELARQKRVLMVRRYHEGNHETRLTARLREFLGDEATEFSIRLNFVRKINKAIAERLVIQGFDSTAKDAEKARQLKFAELVYTGSRMKGKRARNILEAVRDGDYYILIDPDEENRRARLTPHQCYTDSTTSAFGAAGDGEGMWMKYPNDDPDQKPEYAVKRWTEQTVKANGTVGTQKRVNIYFADRVEKYYLDGAQWKQLAEKNGTWPLYWTDSTGKPLGIPVVHVKTPELQPAALEAIPGQRAINKTFVDLLASSDANAFRIIISFGWDPVDADGKPLEITPGVMMGTDATEGNVQIIEGADLSNQIAVIDKQIGWMADVTDIPLSLLNRSNQRAAEGTLQEEKESFIAKVRDYAETIEMAYEDALKIARRVQNTFFDGGLEEEPEFKIIWGAFNVRSTEDKAREAEALTASGVTQDYIWRNVWGIDENTVKAMQLAQFGDGAPVSDDADSSGGVDAGIEAETTLNGAQIAAALEVITKLGNAEIEKLTAIELLVAVGISRDKAEAMANQAKANPDLAASSLNAVTM